MNNINDIFQFLAQNKPLLEALGTIYGIVKNYQRDKNLASHDKELLYIKNVLGLTTYELTDNQLKIIDIFLDKSAKYNHTINWIDIDFDELKEKTNINQQELESELQELESESFITINRNYEEYKLSYDIFLDSDLIYKLSDKSTDYYMILRMVIDILLQIDDKGRITEINVEKFMEEHSLNHFFINPLMYHLKKLDIIEYEESLQPSCLLDTYFYFEGKAKLLKLNKQLSLKDK